MLEPLALRKERILLRGGRREELASARKPACVGVLVIPSANVSPAFAWNVYSTVVVGVATVPLTIDP